MSCLVEKNYFFLLGCMFILLLCTTEGKSICKIGYMFNPETFDCKKCKECSPGYRLLNKCYPNNEFSSGFLEKCILCNKNPHNITFYSKGGISSECNPCKTCYGNEEVLHKCTESTNTVCRCRKGFYRDKISDECSQRCCFCERRNVTEPECIGMPDGMKCQTMQHDGGCDGAENKPTHPQTRQEITTTVNNSKEKSSTTAYQTTSTSDVPTTTTTTMTSPTNNNDVKPQPESDTKTFTVMIIMPVIILILLVIVIVCLYKICCRKRQGSRAMVTEMNPRAPIDINFLISKIPDDLFVSVLELISGHVGNLKNTQVIKDIVDKIFTSEVKEILSKNSKSNVNLDEIKTFESLVMHVSTKLPEMKVVNFLEAIKDVEGIEPIVRAIEDKFCINPGYNNIASNTNDKNGGERDRLMCDGE